MTKYIVGFVAIFLLFTFLLGFRTVDTGEIGVVTNFGKVTGRILNPGASTITPFIDGVLTYNTKKVIYETAVEANQKSSKADYKDFPVDTNTKDGQQIDVAYTVRFSVDPTKVTWIASNIGSELALVDKIVKTESRVWVRNIVREYTADELYTGNVAEVQHKIEEKIGPTFSDNGLILDSLGIREIKFSDQYAQAIESKQIEAVNVQKAENIAARAIFEKNARITAAEASAKEQELQRTTISPELLQKMWIEKWKGDVPATMLGNDSQMLFMVPQGK